MRDVIEIQTQRLTLKPISMGDAPRIARFANDPAVARMITSAPLPYLQCAAEGWIMTLNARAPLGEDFVFGVHVAGEGLVGVIGAHKKRGGAFDVGYWVGRPYWGRGFASETLNGFVSEARGLGQLIAGHFVDNPASGRVLQKAGFVYTGETDEAYSLGRMARAPVKRMRYAPAIAAPAHDHAMALH
ncbi:MAG: GNAT family N-acetyltransferase [Hyphomonadaceae bacterium]|nr:GNAT family N-acetyltransferase [Hyphomonadaceae bacterium]MBX3510973.1 GNAT family N-acetyltransferase [Hyphomonadaceae bacterium]